MDSLARATQEKCEYPSHSTSNDVHEKRGEFNIISTPGPALEEHEIFTEKYLLWH